jgi:hypothetical protein
MAERGLVPTVDEAIAYARDCDPLDRAELAKRLEEIRALSEKAQASLAESEREVRNLSSLYVMHVRLFEELTSRAVADAVQEIIINFLGSEDFVFYVRDVDRPGFVPRAGMGPAKELARPFTPDSAGAPLVAALSSPEPSYSTPGSVAVLTVLGAGGQPVGLLDVKSLMRHKRWLNSRDKELLSILRTQAGMALGISLEREGAR